MPKPNSLRPQPAAYPSAALNADQLRRQATIQRVWVVTLGCLWFLAFATGCSRNSKNCSAYDGVKFAPTVEVAVPQSNQD